MLATPRYHGRVSGTCTTVGIVITSPASASRTSHRSAAARQPQPRRLDLRGRLGREAGREFLLERAKVEFCGAGHACVEVGFVFQPIAAIFASSSSRLTGLTM